MIRQESGRLPLGACLAEAMCSLSCLSADSPQTARGSAASGEELSDPARSFQTQLYRAASLEDAREGHGNPQSTPRCICFTPDPAPKLSILPKLCPSQRFRLGRDGKIKVLFAPRIHPISSHPSCPRRVESKRPSSLEMPGKCLPSLIFYPNAHLHPLHHIS